MALAGSATASVSTIYSNIPSTLSNSYPSVGFQATTTSELGSRINFAGTARQLSGVSITMVNWARYEDYNAGGQSYGSGQWAGNGFTHSFTLNIYAAGTGSTPGALLYTTTESKFIAYRPTGWATNGYAQNISFDLSAAGITVPESIVWGLAYNTETRGYNPIGTAGPYNSLNMGVGPTATTVGSQADSSFFVASPYYNPTGANGGNGFSLMTESWAQNSYQPMAEFTAVPAPGVAALLGMAGLAARRRRS
jgi:MYXO-CTERM domain-containing protein